MEITTCPNCSKPNLPGLSSCSYCGAALIANPEQPPASGQGESPAPMQDFLSVGYMPGTQTFLGKVLVTPAQQAQTDLLREIVAAESKTPPAAPAPTSPPPSRLYWLVAGLLFVIIGISLLTGKPSFHRPALPEETAALRQVIYNLPPGTPVLVAIDYQPGFSAEIHQAAQGVLAHLMTQSTYLMLLSTHPTGAIQGELLIEDIGRATGAPYVTPEQYQNLGYLPGGPAGLLAFADAPQQVMPLTASGEFAWQSPFTQSVERIADFGLLIVLTEDPDSARDWIEQVAPKLDGTPIAFVLSAQAAPMLRPYYENRPQQIQGMVSGVADGVAYQDTSMVTALDRGIDVSWPAYSLGLWAGAAMMLFGGIGLLAKTLTDQERSSANGAAKS